MKTLAVIAAAALAGCAMSSGIMERSDGTYTVSAFAAPLRGGAAGARGYAFEQAQAYCEKSGRRAVLVERPEDQVLMGQYTGASSASTLNAKSGIERSGVASVPMAAGQSSIAFMCK